MKVDVAIIGSGFAGSILAWILASRGRKVALIDRQTHPRFAIGESSTPIADKLLMRLGQQYGLPDLVQLSTYGSWQEHHREIACGKKRGFSYYLHEKRHPFQDTNDHARSLLVAASASDQVADTHWFRSDTDSFFFAKAINAGAIDFSGHEVTDIQTGADTEAVNRITVTGNAPIESTYLIDASGAANVVARFTGAKPLTSSLLTNTQSTYAHYRGVGSWSGQFGSLDDPFDGDDAAQHHLLEDAWLWMLRFNNGVTSVGMTGRKIDDRLLDQYPTLSSMLNAAKLDGGAKAPVVTGRLQRLFNPVVGPSCWMLPTAAVTIDPLHSTGIAHALAGVDRTARMILNERPTAELTQYGNAVLTESRLLDRLVSTAYGAMNDFPRFTAACMLYFAAAIVCEERYQAGDTPTHLFNADDDQFAGWIGGICDAFDSELPTAALEVRVREEIASWNTAGLMDPSAGNRYAYTATKK